MLEQSLEELERHSELRWLKKALAKELGWDVYTLEGIVEAIQAARGQGEVDEIVQDYLGGGAGTKRLVEQFLAAGRGAKVTSTL